MTSATASSLVVAGILSTAIYPLVGLRLRGDRASTESAAPGPPAPEIGGPEPVTA